MRSLHNSVDRILNDFHIDDAVAFLEEVQDKVEVGFSKDPTVFVVGNIELAREKALADNGED